MSELGSSDNFDIAVELISGDTSLKKLEKKELSSVDKKITSMTEVFELQGVKQLKHNEEKYLKPLLNAEKREC